MFLCEFNIFGGLKNAVGNSSGAPAGNKRAVGNKGGSGGPPRNKKAVTTGEYETIWLDALEDEERELLEMNEYIARHFLLKLDLQLFAEGGAGGKRSI
ncbi:hypothetical protein J14TS5_28390 [Paenibacillus lautus]|nr:hypothetical protein J14TS5_28390 [Paenibacillus lautus]